MPEISVPLKGASNFVPLRPERGASDLPQRVGYGKYPTLEDGIWFRRRGIFPFPRFCLKTSEKLAFTPSRARLFLCAQNCAQLRFFYVCIFLHLAHKNLTKPSISAYIEPDDCGKAQAAHSDLRKPLFLSM